MRKDPTYKHILVALFCLCLVAPIAFSLLNFNSKVTLSERRTLAKKPKISLSNFDSTIDQFETYFNDHFGGRNLLIKTYCYFKYFFLGSSPYPNEVEIGKEGWFFLGNNKSKISDEHMGLKLISPKALERIKTNIANKKNWLDQRGIAYYLFIAPDKHTAYPEQLPDHYNQKFINKNTNKIINQLKEVTEVIDVRNELNFHKEKTGKQLYSKTDSHWNDYGAFIAYKKLIRELGKNHKDLGQPHGLGKFNIEEELSKFNTTTDMINIAVKDIDYTFTYKFKKPEKGKSILTVPKSYDKSKKGYEVRYTYNQGSPLKILVFRDSFSNRLMKFLSLHFRESVYINNYHKFDKSIILKEKPDIILHEIVERSTQEFLRTF